MNNHLLPQDTGWPEDNAFIADLSQLNADIARYVLRYFDADAGRAQPISPHDENLLGQRLIDLGERVQHRATRRAVHSTGKRPVVEGETAHPRELEPGRGSDMDHGP